MIIVILKGMLWTTSSPLATTLACPPLYCETDHLVDSIKCPGAAEGVGALEPEPEQHHLHPHSCLPWMPQGLIGSAILSGILIRCISSLFFKSSMCFTADPVDPL